MASKKAGDDNAGSKRAADFHDAMLGLPGYGDDSMLFVVRYVSQVKQKLRECDFDEFIKCYSELDKLWSEKGDEVPGDGPSRYEKAQELKAQALEKIQDYPDLVRDLDRFMSTGRSVSRTYDALEKK